MAADRILRGVIQRLSLRPPQAHSLEILADVADRISLKHGSDPGKALAAIRAAYPQVEAFDRDFPSLCFALATGVGKTRLMGAFIAYLYLTGRSRHFFVLAPNRTIYEKLQGDFRLDSPKYVFKGISEFVTNQPLIITGDDYETGRGTRTATGRTADLFGGDIHINIFNIDKINKEESPRGRPRMRRLQETIGQSYYDYLAGLDDLVLLMDEAHRYRATAGARAINELRPILGLELTATPKSVGAQAEEFRNVIFRYDLAEAMKDGFVKDPYVATRKDFDPSTLGEAELERIKLEDAVQYHDFVTVELERYARVSGRRKVHPFILVVAQDTAHADDLERRIIADDFFGGRFKDRVLVVHSNKTGAESDEAMERLVALEHDGRTDIVIHVNKLKEGWDVTNLYTLVPLRASASDILTEQTLGRGLRLPYGERITKTEDDEFAALDRLTVIAHDRFDDIIAKAREPGSIVMKTIIIGEGGDIPAGARLVEAPSAAENLLTGKQADLPGMSDRPQAPFDFSTPEDRSAVEVTMEVIRRYERRLTSVDGLRDPEVRRAIETEVREITRPRQGTLEGTAKEPDYARIVETVTGRVADLTISIPHITVVPKRTVTFRFRDFDLAGLDSIRQRPREGELVVENLRTGHRGALRLAEIGQREERLEDHLVGHLIERDEIDYDATANLLYKLAGQVTGRLATYLDEMGAATVVQQNARLYADLIFAEMMNNYEETPLREEDFEIRVTKGFTILDPQPFNVAPGVAARDYRKPVVPLADTKKHVFTGFAKCCYTLQKFHSDPERRFAVLLERDGTVLKWLKPGRAQFQIETRAGDAYEPDFVVETADRLLISEVKREDEIADAEVQAKAAAAVLWCRHATEAGSAKPWAYLLIPDDEVTGNATLGGLANRFERRGA